MARRSSVRLWQTELFVIVILVAILILSVSLSRGLQNTLRRLGETDQLGDAAALAAQVGHEFPITPQTGANVRGHVEEFRAIYGDDVWVYDASGAVIHAANESRPPQHILDRARDTALRDEDGYATMSLERDGFVVAGAPIRDDSEKIVGATVISGPVVESLAVLDAVRSRLWATFWVALIVAGLLGMGFSEFISRRVRLMSQAAKSMAAGDFEQRIPTGLVPDEVFELAESYNRMAAKLGETFSVLREREREIAGVVESMAEGVIAFDADGSVRVVNPIALRLLGRAEEPESSIGRPLEEVVASDVVLRLVGDALAGSPVSGIATLGDSTVLVHATPLAAVVGEPEARPSGAVLILADITEQKRIEEAQRRFVANASHELRTPISALKGLLELLTGGAKDDPDVRDDFLQTMSVEVDRLGRLVADLLTLAQIDAGALKLRREPTDVTGLLDDVAQVMRPLAAQSGVVLVLDAPPEPVQVDADRDRVTQVLLGFVDNAMRHTPAGAHVTLRAATAVDMVRLEVADEGVGIDAEAIPRLFDRFFRVDESRSGPRSTGLGLSIAKEIVEAHGSEIRVDSTRGEGSTFGFDLPIAR